MSFGFELVFFFAAQQYVNIVVVHEEWGSNRRNSNAKSMYV